MDSLPLPPQYVRFAQLSLHVHVRSYVGQSASLTPSAGQRLSSTPPCSEAPDGFESNLGARGARSGASHRVCVYVQCGNKYSRIHTRIHDMVHDTSCGTSGAPYAIAIRNEQLRRICVPFGARESCTGTPPPSPPQPSPPWPSPSPPQTSPPRRRPGHYRLSYQIKLTSH